MMTLIGKLCALCAVNAVLQSALPDTQARGGLRMIGGMLLLQLVLEGLSQIQAQLCSGDLAGMLACLMG